MFTLIQGRSPKNLRVVGFKQALYLSCNSTQREPVIRRLRVTLLGFCRRVVVNEAYINLEKTTSSFQSVILINEKCKEDVNISVELVLVLIRGAGFSLNPWS